MNFIQKLRKTKIEAVAMILIGAVLYGFSEESLAQANQGATAISAGNDYTCEIFNGVARCWGSNGTGQLGDGPGKDGSRFPVQVRGLTSSATEVSAGTDHTCAIHDGAASCWGANSRGQLGDGTAADSSLAVPVNGLTSDVTAIAAGEDSTCAIHNGAAKCWGGNSEGQLGDGTQRDSLVPVSVRGLSSSATSISAGGSHTCAIHHGAAKCWGDNSEGQLGDGTKAGSSTPVQVHGLTSGVTAISAGTDHSCAIHDGAAKCWGSNFLGRLGDGTVISGSTPVQVVGLTSGVTAISAGHFHSCAVHNGAARCWGNNSGGQLGDGTGTSGSTPVQVLGLTSGVTAISAGYLHSCAIHDGMVKCWGANSSGQLGDGTGETSSAPVRVIVLDGDWVGNYIGATDGDCSVSAAINDAIALRAEGSRTVLRLVFLGTPLELEASRVRDDVYRFTEHIPSPLFRGGSLRTTMTLTFTPGNRAPGMQVWTYESGSGDETCSANLILHRKTLAPPVVNLDVSQRSVVVRWDQIEEGANLYRYELYSAGDTAEVLVVQGLVVASLMQRSLSHLNPGSTYYLRIFSALGSNTAASNAAESLFITVPAIDPVHVTGRTARLTWPVTAAMAQTYQLSWVDPSGGRSTQEVLAQEGNYMLTGLQPQTEYIVRVVAQQEGYPDSKPLFSTPFTTLGVLDTAVLRVMPDAETSANVVLSWGSVANATAYVVAWQITDNVDTLIRDEVVAVPASTQTYTIMGLSPESIYTITVTARAAGYDDGPPGYMQWPGFTAISAGVIHTCAVRNGAVRCWGDNDSGQLGDGTAEDSSFAVQVRGLTSGVTAIAVGGSGLNEHSCAIQNGAAKCWGKNLSGQLGNGMAGDPGLVPVQVHGLTSGVSAIAAGSSHSCAIHHGAARCWGRNNMGQLGDGTRAGRSTPVQVLGLTSGVTAIAAGFSHSCAVHNGAARCWGENSAAQLGDGTRVGSSMPVQVHGLTSSVTAIAVGSSHTCAIHNGAAKCWGENFLGQLGDGTVAASSTPVQVRGLTSGVTAISVGFSHSCAIHHGAARCWGENSATQLGDGTRVGSSTSVQVRGLTSGVTAISAGSSHSCAIHHGAARCWGSNDEGQLGTGVRGASPVPARVIFLDGDWVGTYAGAINGGCSFGERSNDTISIQTEEHGTVLRLTLLDIPLEFEMTRVRGNTYLATAHTPSPLFQGGSLSTTITLTFTSGNRAQGMQVWIYQRDDGEGTCSANLVFHKKTLASPLVSLDVGQRSVVVHWDQIAEGSILYRYELHSTRDTGGILVAQGTAASLAMQFTLDHLNPGSTYYLRVFNAVAANAAASNAAESSFITMPAIDQVKVGVRTATLTWAVTAATATTYRFSWTAPSGEQTIRAVPAPAGSYTLTGLMPGTSYTLSVVAQAESLTDSEAYTDTFRTKTMLAMPLLEVSVNETTLSFSWSEIENAAGGYRVKLYAGTDTTVQPLRLVEDVETRGGRVSVETGGLFPVETYTLEVIALAAAGSTEYADSERSLLTAQTEALTLPLPTEAEIDVHATTDTVTVAVIRVATAYKALYPDGDLDYLVHLEREGSLQGERQTLNSADTAGAPAAYTYQNLRPNTGYELVVIASSPDHGLFNNSAPVRFGVRTEKEQLPVPTGLTIAADLTTAMVSWNTAALSATTYLISYMPDGKEAVEVTVAVSDGNHTLAGLMSGTTYTLSIVAQAQGYRDSEAYETRFKTQSDVIDRIRFRLRVFLQGATETSPSGAFMRTGLVLRGQLPASSSLARPWLELPENIAETEVLPANRDVEDRGVISKVLAGVPEHGSTGIVDWVVVEVRMVDGGSTVPFSATAAKRVRRAYALLRSDGSVVNAEAGDLLSADGVFEMRGLDFSSLTEDLYVIINHRNHTGIISETQSAAAGVDTYSYDFTMMSAEASRAAGMSLRAGVWTLSAGDYDGNGDVNLADYKAQAGEFGGAGYLLGDIDLDADVNLNDRSVLIDSIGKSQLFRN